MKLREMMTRGIEVISKEASLTEAANTMARLDIGFLPVLDGTTVVGTITDRDIVVRAVATGRDASLTRVESIMSPGAEVLSPDTDIEDAARRMEDKRIRRIVLQDEKGAYVGVVSLGDLAKRTPDPQLSGETMEKVCGSLPGSAITEILGQKRGTSGLTDLGRSEGN